LSREKFGKAEVTFDIDLFLTIDWNPRSFSRWIIWIVIMAAIDHR